MINMKNNLYIIYYAFYVSSLLYRYKDLIDLHYKLSECHFSIFWPYKYQ